jgi:hypothetical protein
MTREQNKQVGQHDDLDRQCYSRQHLERSEADHRDARLNQAEDHADPDQRIGDAGYFREHRDDGRCADKGLEREPVDRHECPQQRGDQLCSPQPIDGAGRDLTGDPIVDPQRRHDQIEEECNNGPKKSGSHRGLERQPGRHHQAPAQHDAGVDQEVEHDAEEVEPAGRLALFRNGFDAELLDAGGLTVARAQAALDVDCGSHEAILRAASTKIDGMARLAQNCRSLGQ